MQTGRLRAGRRIAAAALSAAAATALAGAVAPAAVAGTYTVYGCSDPVGAAAGLDGWAVAASDGAAAQSSNGCPAGPLALALSETATHRPGDRIEAGFSVPAGTTIESYRLWRSGQVSNAGRFEYEIAELGATPDPRPVERCVGLAGCRRAGEPTAGVAPGNLFQRIAAPGTTGLRLTVACAPFSSSLCRGRGGPVAALQLHRSEITLRDDHAPAITAVRGRLVTSKGVLRGRADVSVAAADLGGGVHRIALEIDGAMVAGATLDENGGACAPPFRATVPCRTSVRGGLRLDTARLSDGIHSVRVLVSDAAGNVAAHGPVPLVTANASCDRTPRAKGPKLRGGLVAKGKGKRVRRVLTTRSGKRLAVRGKLRAGGGPVAGARVCVLVRRAKGGGPVRVKAIPATNAKGRFRVRLGAAPSRKVWLVHRTPGGSVVRVLRAKVRPRIHVRPNDRRLRNGDRLVLRGRVPGPRPRNGTLVELQVWRGTFWQTIDAGRTKQRGRYVRAYRFRATTGVQRYRFRIKVPAQRGYPYAAGTSRSVRVTVRG